MSRKFSGSETEIPVIPHNCYFLKMEFASVGDTTDSEAESIRAGTLIKDNDSLISSIYINLSLVEFPWDQAVQLTEAELLNVLYSYVMNFLIYNTARCRILSEKSSIAFQEPISWSPQAGLP